MFEYRQLIILFLNFFREIATRIRAAFNKYVEPVANTEMKDRFKCFMSNAGSDVSVACDYWTSPNGIPFLGVTGRFLTRTEPSYEAAFWILNKWILRTPQQKRQLR